MPCSARPGELFLGFLALVLLECAFCEALSVTIAEVDIPLQNALNLLTDLRTLVLNKCPNRTKIKGGSLRLSATAHNVTLPTCKLLAFSTLSVNSQQLSGETLSFKRQVTSSYEVGALVLAAMGS